MVGQVTLRTDSVDPMESFYSGLGLKLLSRQVIDRFNFELRFYAGKTEEDGPPQAGGDENKRKVLVRRHCKR